MDPATLEKNLNSIYTGLWFIPSYLSHRVNIRAYHTYQDIIGDIDAIFDIEEPQPDHDSNYDYAQPIKHITVTKEQDSIRIKIQYGY